MTFENGLRLKEGSLSEISHTGTSSGHHDHPRLSASPIAQPNYVQLIPPFPEKNSWSKSFFHLFVSRSPRYQLSIFRRKLSTPPSKDDTSYIEFHALLGVSKPMVSETIRNKTLSLRRLQWQQIWPTLKCRQRSLPKSRYQNTADFLVALNSVLGHE